MFGQIAWAYRFWGIDEGLNKCWDDWYGMVSTIVTEIAHDTTSKYTAFLQESNFIFEPAMGNIQIDIRLPSNRHSLLHLLDINSSPEYQSMIAFKEKLLPENRLTAWDYWHMYKPHSNVANWVPPFKSKLHLHGFLLFLKLFRDLILTKCSN